MNVRKGLQEIVTTKFWDMHPEVLSVLRSNIYGNIAERIPIVATSSLEGSFLMTAKSQFSERLYLGDAGSISEQIKLNEDDRIINVLNVGGPITRDGDGSFLSSRVTVLGEVRSPGTYGISNGKMTILEALGRAGDLTQYGRRDNVLITREINGKLEFARLDLRSDEIFTSPYFYLQSNDVIMVSPNQARTTSNQSIGLWLSLAGTLSSAATVVVTVLTYQARTTGN